MASTAPAAERLVTADELLRISGDGFRRELVRGVVLEMTAAGLRHGHIALRIGSSLQQHVEPLGLGIPSGAETGFKLGSNPDTVLAPDASFIRAERVAAAGGESDAYFIGAPDLAVEVMSPSDSVRGAEAKAFAWIAAGCRMVVVVNPKRRIATVYRSRDDVLLLTENDVLDGGDVVPGWTLVLREVFA